jgi:hypothetical protein
MRQRQNTYQEKQNQNTETQLFIKVYVCNVSVPLKLKRCIRRINKLSNNDQ